MTSSIGQGKSSMRLVGDEIPLCKDCRFLKWHRKTTSITDSGNSISEIQHWISGAAATASDLAEAAGKTATYSGGLVGAVAGAGILQEKTGSFDARVQFGVSAYQVQNFRADFDGSRYSGASALTPNNTVFHVTGSSGTRTLQAGGYFFGGTTRGNAPPISADILKSPVTTIMQPGCSPDRSASVLSERFISPDGVLPRPSPSQEGGSKCLDALAHH